MVDGPIRHVSQQIWQHQTRQGRRDRGTQRLSGTVEPLDRFADGGMGARQAGEQPSQGGLAGPKLALGEQPGQQGVQQFVLGRLDRDRGDGAQAAGQVG